MNEKLKIIALESGMKLQTFFPDEYGQHGWHIISCTDNELEIFSRKIINICRELDKTQYNERFGVLW